MNGSMRLPVLLARGCGWIVLGTLVGERAMFGIALLLALSLVAQVWLACFGSS